MTPPTQSGRKEHNMKTYVKPIVYIIMMAEAPLLSGSGGGGGGGGGGDAKRYIGDTNDTEPFDEPFNDDDN